MYFSSASGLRRSWARKRCHLLFEGEDPRRQQAAQAQRVALALGEGGALVVEGANLPMIVLPAVDETRQARFLTCAASPAWLGRTLVPYSGPNTMACAPARKIIRDHGGIFSTDDQLQGSSARVAPRRFQFRGLPDLRAVLLGLPCVRDLKTWIPRKFIRMAMLGMNEELSTTPWIWCCTLCKRCQYVCPMSIDVSQLVFLARGNWPQDRKPTGIVRSCQLAQATGSTSAMGMPPADFVSVVDEVLQEVRSTQPGFARLQAPIDKGRAFLRQPELARADERARRDGAAVEDLRRGRR
jgi:hypothetical protein